MISFLVRKKARRYIVTLSFVTFLGLAMLAGCSGGDDVDSTPINNNPTVCESGIFTDGICVVEPPELPVEELPCNTTTPKTSLSGIISFDKLLENLSEYEIDGTIQILEGVTLTIEQGTVIQSGAIEVFGSLDVRGSELKPVIFNNVIIKGGGGTYTSSLKISHARFNSGGIDMGVRHNSFILEDSILQSTNEWTLYAHPNDVPDYIERNIFLNTGGVTVYALAWEQTFIRNNYFYNPTTQYAIKNSLAVYDYPIITEYNSFVEISKYAVILEPPVSPGFINAAMTAYNNYWGTEDINIIEQLIYDLNDDINADSYIPFIPYLTEHHADTPVPADENNDGIPDIINECLR